MEILRHIIQKLKNEENNNRKWLRDNFELASDDKFTAVAINDKYFKLFPGPEFSTFIYRGQVSFHNPCVSNIFRNNRNHSERFIALLQLCEFSYLLKNHPIVLDVQKLKIDNKVMKLDYEGMAQHYGLLTELLDFTSDLDIALFFATNNYDEYKDVYMPVMDKSRIGVLYKYNYAFDFSSNYINPNHEAIGLQPLPRPGFQKTYSYRLKNKNNLNNQKYIETIMFQHDPVVSIYYSGKYESGKKLFPYDPIDSKTKLIKNSKIFSIRAFDSVYENNHSLSRSHIINKLQAHGISVEDTLVFEFTKDELSEIQTHWDAEKINFLAKIGIRLSYYADINES